MGSGPEGAAVHHDIMKKHMQTLGNDVDRLAHDANGFMTAAADATADRLADARKGLVSVLNHGTKFYGFVRGKVADGTKAADHAVHEHSYGAIAIGLGVGAIVGYLAASMWSWHRE